ncbi:hypothetical protein SUGI_0449190 [Cryptomeria japonica]|nr:hypothetical protein SUGI_0449190 [Cryptomeria japonica]
MESSSAMVPFPLLTTPIETTYRPCTIPYRFTSDSPHKPTPAELAWIEVFRKSIPSFRQANIFVLHREAKVEGWGLEERDDRNHRIDNVPSPTREEVKVGMPRWRSLDILIGIKEKQSWEEGHVGMVKSKNPVGIKERLDLDRKACLDKELQNFDN